MLPHIVKDAPRPGSPKWRTTVSASKVPAILGISRWKSQFAVWHEMAGLVEPPPPDEAKQRRFLWGHLIEESLAQFWKANNEGWLLNARRGDSAELTYTNPDLPFDNLATLDRRAMNRKFAPGDPRRFHIVECKLAQDLKDNLDSWGRPGEPDSIPSDYFAQVQFQMGVSGIHQASVVVLGAFGDPEIHPVEFDPVLFEEIVKRISVFARSIEVGTPPELDDSLATYETVRGLHPDIDRAGVVQVDALNAAAMLDAVLSADKADKAARAAKTRAADLMGNARLLKCGDVKIADRRVKAGGRPYVQFNKNVNLKELTNV